MPYRTIPGTATQYFLLAVDQKGSEFAKDPDASNGPLSVRLRQHLKDTQATDLFCWIHGWKGDFKGAAEQFDRWIGAFERNDDDRQRMLTARPGFKACHLGFHWPSLSWGDEDVLSGSSFSPVDQGSLEQRLDFHAAELGDTPAVRAALRTLLEEARSNAAATALSDTALQAYLDLDAALDLGDGGQPGNGGEDRQPFDPRSAFESAADGSPSFGDFSNRFLAPLRQLTFWTMKKRARTVGERGLNRLLRTLQTDDPQLHIHLMGHSFGCIVASASLVGVRGQQPLPAPVHSCVLVQGALSLWAYSDEIPYGSTSTGYFQPLLAGQRVKGALAVTLSRHDYAVGRIYPWAAGVANQIDFAPGQPPRFGAIGEHGICGVSKAQRLDMLPASATYGFQPGGLYNIDGSAFIKDVSDRLSGAHSDIGGAEVAHVIWEAAL